MTIRCTLSVGIHNLGSSVEGTCKASEVNGIFSTFFAFGSFVDGAPEVERRDLTPGSSVRFYLYKIGRAHV